MFKKIVSFLSALSLLAINAVPVAFAVDIQTDTLLASPLVLSVLGGNAQAFNPAGGETLNMIVVFGEARNSATLTLQVKKDNIVLKTLGPIVENVSPAAPKALTWNGKDIDNNAAAQAVCGNLGSACPAGDYSVTATLTVPSGNDTLRDTETAAFRIGAANAIAINSFTLTVTPPVDGGTFDPSPSGNNQDLTIFHDLSVAPDSGNIEIKNSKNELMRTFPVTLQSANDSWDGLSGTKLVPPGNYSATITATKGGVASTPKTENFIVAYNNVNKGEIQNFTIDPLGFDPDVEEAVIEFKNTKDTDITVEVFAGNGGRVRTFDGYRNDNYSANSVNKISWDGKNDSSNVVSLGAYKVVITTRNDFGVVVDEKAVTVDNSEGTIPTSNAHVADISLKPSSTFEPAVDDDLEVEFDVEMDLDELKIFAVKGVNEIELFNEQDVQEENNIQITWDGTDENADSDSNYADDGTWRIEFRSKKDSTELKAGKTIKIAYEKPEIRDFFVSKAKFDNDVGEFTYAIFRVDADAQVTITEMQDNSEENDIVEDMEVEKDKWYAVKWDGGSFDYQDDMDLKLIATNKVNSDVFDSNKIGVDLAEDTESNSRADIIGDYIEPVVSDGNKEMVIYYSTDDVADVNITIHSGKTGSGTEKNSFEINNQGAGEHSISWDGRDKNGSKLAAGFYTYKIVSRASSTDTETGVFVVGTVGDVDGGWSGSVDNSGGGSGTETGNCIPGIVIDGKSCDSGDGGGDNIIPPLLDSCGGFADVLADDSSCEAIQWVEAEGIFKGYDDGTFRPVQNINRAEFLKVVLEAVNEGTSVVKGNLGFIDVDVNAWYMGYIARAKTLGIFAGDQGKGTARPADPINRVESLKLLAETLRATGGFKVTACDDLVYSDVSGTSWFYNYVCFNDQYSLFMKTGFTTFGPGRFASREELAEALYTLHLNGVL